MADEVQDTPLEQLHAIVHGRVQGVSFRYYTQLRAAEMGVTGWVRNLPDRTVEVTAEGERAQLERLLRFLRQGPTGASVTKVDADWWPATGAYSGFNIRY
ncbi:MAG: acylphosphatase [Anaerolineaceae bacterium]|nr:acylphosphatase [Anaerolineaceae bacterium]